jgi:MOSC domain-containing protein YiiM
VEARAAGGIGAARVVSVNVGLPRLTTWRGKTVETGIFKDPVAGPVRIAGVNLDGDGQADLTVHGGRDKAVYAYPAEHYPTWRGELGRDLPWGVFGENLTLEGLPLEDEICIGDRLRIGSAELIVSQPRVPCFKLGIRFEDPRMVRRFLVAGRSGYYLRIAIEGEVSAGDEVEVLSRDSARLPVAEISRLFVGGRHDQAGLRRALGVDSLADVWKPYFEGFLDVG